MTKLKAYYAPGERGWVEDLGNGFYKLINVPLSKNLRWGDIVTLNEEQGIFTVERVVERKLPHRGYIEYDETSQWPSIVAVFEARYRRGNEYALEGGFNATKDRPGRALINFKDTVDIKHAIADLDGVRFVSGED